MAYNQYRKRRGGTSPTKTMLQAIWAEGGRVPDMSRMERKKGGRFFRVFAALFVFFGLLATISWLGVFLTKGRVQSGGVILTIDVPQNINNFDEATIAIRYQNHESSPLAATTIDLRYPQEIQITEVDPKADNESNTRWSLGSLGSGDEGVITLKGKILGTIGKKLNLQAILAYRPSNFNSDFQTVKTAEFAIRDSPIALSSTAPEEIISGELVSLEAEIENTGEETLNDILLAFDIPESLAVNSSEPKLDNENSITFKTLKAREKKKIKISGAFEPEAEGTYTITARAIKIIGEREVILKESPSVITVKRNNFIARLFVNERAEDQQVKPGDTLQVRVDVSNQTGSDAEGIKLSILSSSQLINWSRVATDPKGKTSDDGITWDPKSFTKLTKIKHGETASLSFPLPLLSSGVSGDPLIRLTVVAAVSKIGGRAVEDETRSQEIRLRVASDLKVSSSARYWADKKTAMGSGPLPPEVGKETSYRVIWRLSNTLHELENVKASALLPSNVRFAGKKSLTSGTLAFDPSSRAVTWLLDRAPADAKLMEAQFDVILIPGETDRGKISLLLGETEVQARDVSLGTDIATRGGSLTTNLDGDPVAEGKGVVK